MNRQPRLPGAQGPGSHPQSGSHELLPPIEQHYSLCDQSAVLGLLERSRQLVPVLHDLAALIPEHFPGAALYLRVVNTAPTRDAPDGRRLVLFIATDLGFAKAMERMDRLMAAWQPDRWAETPGPFSVDVAFGTTAADVETAVLRFARTHGADQDVQHDLAQRLLHAEPGTREEDLARAELAAALAEERGATTHAAR